MEKLFQFSTQDALITLISSTITYLLIILYIRILDMKKERVLKSEVYAAVRQKGLKSVKQVYAVVLETNSTISIIANDNSDELAFSLTDVQGLPEGLKKDLKKHADQ